MYVAGYIVTGFIVAGVYASAWLQGPPRPLPPHRPGRRAQLRRARRACAGRSSATGRGGGSPRSSRSSSPRWRACSRPRRARRSPSAATTTTSDGRGEVRHPGAVHALGARATTTRTRPCRAWTPCRRGPPAGQRRALRVPDHGRASGRALALLGVVFGVTWWRKRRLPQTPWFYRAVMAAGPLSLVALICGWITTEVGRQPWIVYQTMRTTDAVTASNGLEVGFAVLVRVYLFLAAALSGCSAASPRSRPRPRWRRRCALMLPEICLGLVVLGITAYAVLGGADFGAGFWDLTAGGDAPRRPRARHGAALDEPGVGGQPRVADLRARDRVDGVPGRLRLDLLHAARAAVPRRARDHLPRLRVRAARPGRDDPRGPRARRGVRALLRARAVLPRRGARRRRLGPRAGGQHGRRRGRPPG